MQHGPWLKDFLVFLVAAGLIVPLFRRARIGAVLGFLLIGGGVVAGRSRDGRRVYYGDAGRPEMLERVGGRHARAFVVTVNTPRAAERMIAAARSVQPKARVFARAVDPEHALQLRRIGAIDVIPEAVEASLQLGGSLLRALGLSDEAVMLRLSDARRAELERMENPQPCSAGTRVARARLC